MQTIRWRVMALICLGLLAACSGEVLTTSAPTEPPPLATATPRPTSTPATTPTRVLAIPDVPEADRFVFEQNARLGRGVNLGNALEAPTEGEWGVTLQESYFDLIRQAGFNSVRVPIRWNAHAQADPPYTIDPAFFDRVDWVVQQATQRNLAVVLNIHHYEEIMTNPEEHEQRFLSLWDQIARHYKNAPDSVFFELLNEPNGKITIFSWNPFALEAMQVIRESNPNRTIILGPGNWNSISNLYELKLPSNERNVIVTVHYYLPFPFTHQGAEWVDGADAYLGTKWSASKTETYTVDKDFDVAASW
nr:glycoside hydrolase family 5 protein [Anaerolinea sp.]